MGRLVESAEDMRGLRSLLQRFAYAKQEDDARKSVFENARVILLTLNYTLNPADFADRALASLNREAGPGPNRLQLLFEYLLEGDPENYGLIEEDVALCQRLMESWQKPSGSKKPAGQQRRRSKVEEIRRQLTPIRPSRSYQIDEDLLTEYDLHSLVAEFRRPLQPPRYGVHMFALGGHYDAFKEHILARFEMCFDDVGLESNRLIQQVGPENLSELAEILDWPELVSEEAIETFLVIMHQRIPCEQMQTKAAEILKDAQFRLQSMLEQRQRILVILWFHDGGDALDMEFKLPAPAALSIMQTLTWFKKKLMKQGVQDPDLQCCLLHLRQKLEVGDVSLRTAHGAMKEIIQRLKDGDEA
jgi:hypothetical protein